MIGNQSLAISRVFLVSTPFFVYKKWVIALILFVSFGFVHTTTGHAAEVEVELPVVPPTGTIVIIEDTVPNSPQDFEFRFDTNRLIEGSFSLDDDGTLSNTLIINDVFEGSYGLNQSPVEGYATTVSCVDPDNESTIAGSLAASIDVDEGEIVTCTFTNHFCPSFPIDVDSEQDLNLAIACYGIQTVAGDYTVNVTTDITLGASLPTISNSNAGIKLLIDGSSLSGGRSAIDGADAYHPVEVDTDTVVEISNLIITNGLARGANPTTDHRQNDGGGIRNLGDLTLTDVEVGSCEAEDEGGGIYSEYGSELTIRRGVIEHNVAEDEGGGIFMEEGSVLFLIDSIVDDNESQSDGGRGGGGGISNYGEATLVNTAVSNNRGVPIVEREGFNESYGGGIDNLGDMQILFDESVSANPSIISNNIASEGGGISNEGYLEISDTTISNNNAEFGAGISVFSFIEFVDETPSGSPSGSPNGLRAVGEAASHAIQTADKEAAGGMTESVVHGITYLTRSTVTGNTALHSGGGISNYGDFEEVFIPLDSVMPSASELMTMEYDLPLNLVIDSSTISYNTAGLGGGLENFTAVAKIHASTFNHNQAVLTSRPDSCCFGTRYSGGGGIFNAGELSVDNSTISHNAALLPDFPPIETGSAEAMGETSPLVIGIGGGILNLDADLESIHNTLSGNTAAEAGGGIYNGFMSGGPPVVEPPLEGVTPSEIDGAVRKSKSATLNRSSYRRSQRIGRAADITNTAAIKTGAAIVNVANEGDIGDGRISAPASVVGIINTIIANSQSGEPLQDGGDCVNQEAGMYESSSAVIADGGYNLIEEIAEDGRCGFMPSPANNNIIGQDPMLGELADNDGATQTHALLAASPALDAADPLLCGGLEGESAAAGLILESPFSQDQRGISRPQGVMPLCDIGSVEMRTSSITLTKMVDNEGGGTLAANNFVLSVTVDGSTTHLSSGDSITLLGRNAALLGETATNQYAFKSLTGTGCPAGLDVEFEVPADTVLSCAITNCFDLDGDGLCAAEDPDDDNDTVDDLVDNCPLIANPGQLNTDFDPIGDVCDPDDDNDGMPDVWEIEHGLDSKNSWDRDLDGDGDGFNNLQEFEFGSDPNVFDQDENQNGIPDSVENRLNIIPVLQLLLLDE